MPYNTKILTVALAVALAVATTANDKPWTSQAMGEECKLSSGITYGDQNSKCCASVQVMLVPMLSAFGVTGMFGIGTDCPLDDFTEFTCATTEEDCAGWAMFNNEETPDVLVQEVCMDPDNEGWYPASSDLLVAYHTACCEDFGGVPCDESLMKGMTGGAAGMLKPGLDADEDNKLDVCGSQVFANCGCQEGSRGYDEGWGGPDCVPAAFLEVEGTCEGPCGSLGTKTSTDGACMCGDAECADPGWCSEGDYEAVECNTETCAPTAAPTETPTAAPTAAPTTAPTAGPDLSGSSSAAAVCASLFGVAAAVVAVM